jgi:glycosyltransferase involved in cell wall biosynthesis
VVPNGIDPTRFPALQDRRAEFGLGAQTPVVGMVARLVPQKDPLTFTHAAMHIAQALPGTSFLMVGDGPLRPAVEEAGRSLIEQGRLILTGMRSDVTELLATMDVVLFPSLWEAQGIALMEAMAASRPVVASALPAHAEAIADGENGVLVPPGDPARLAEAVGELLADPRRREMLGRRARQCVEARYSVERMIEATVEIYRSVLTSSR